MKTKKSSRTRVVGRKVQLFAMPLPMLLAACIPQTQAAEAPAGQQARHGEPKTVTHPDLAQPIRTVQAPRPTHTVQLTPPVTSAAMNLDARIRSLGEAFPGKVGIAVRDIETGWTSHYNGTSYYPQQSVSKFWVALAAFDKADRGELDFSQSVTVGRDDLTLFHQPIRELALRPGGFSTTLNNLLFRAITESDNTANDFVMWRAGGPDSVRATIERKGITGVRFGPGERLLQAGIAGMEWKSEYSIGNAFYTARGNVPAEVRRASFNSYVADPIDGATPLGVVDALARLKKGELLSRASTDRLISIMSQTRTGPQRLKGGLAPGWSLAHKTGTGQVFGGAQAGYNDIGIVTSPDGRSYAVAVFIGHTTRPNQERMALMQNVTRAAIDYHRNLATQQQAFLQTN
jgi:beta-lactamase class A